LQAAISDIVALDDGSSGRSFDLDAVITVGEILDPQTRRAILEAFGAKVIDTYACRELGKVLIDSKNVNSCAHCGRITISAPLVCKYRCDAPRRTRTAAARGGGGLELSRSRSGHQRPAGRRLKSPMPSARFRPTCPD